MLAKRGTGGLDPEGGSLPRRKTRWPRNPRMGLTLELEVTISYLIDFDHETAGEVLIT
jgi:hypothetical protein